MTTTQTQISVMLDLQDGMNCHVNQSWRQQNFAWYRAIWIECAELLDHYGWKWWKKQTPDIEQVTLELIDIWHFGLSILLLQNKPIDALAAEIADQLNQANPVTVFAEDLEAFAADTLRSKSFNVSKFATLMAGIDLSFEELFKGYIGKNVLNFFRQDHGYKEGTYVKVWSGREDNEHLVEVLQVLNADDADFKDAVYKGLSVRYAEATG